jgi:hypothetical protein
MTEETIKLSYYIEETENNGGDFNIQELMDKITLNKLNDNLLFNNEFIIPQMVNYNINYNVKELFIICEYYGIAKQLKKYNKEQIIESLVIFETNPQNSEIVNKRKNMWFYINELKNDKFMKKYVLWK